MAEELSELGSFLECILKGESVSLSPSDFDGIACLQVEGEVAVRAIVGGC